MHDDFEEDEQDFPTEDGARFIGGTSSLVLWNKIDIFLEMPTPTSLLGILNIITKSR